MADSLLLVLPYLAAAQAQKHVTHNDALALIDGLIHLSVIARNATTPPVTPGDGDRYLLGALPTGEWATKAGTIAFRVEGLWRYLTPRKGWRSWIETEGVLLIFDGTNWVAPPSPSVLQNISLLGVNATADATNKMAVSSSAVLFNHAGSGTQVKLNKNAASDTASFLYQTNFSGRAEFGTTGDDGFHIKMSPDGSTWREALSIDGPTALATVYANPTANLGIATKQYVDAVTQSISGQVQGRILHMN